MEKEEVKITDKLKTYITKYNTQNLKYFIMTVFGFSIFLIGFPLVFTIAAQELHPQIPWLNLLKYSLYGMEVIFFLAVVTSYVLKERYKLLSLLIFEFAQFFIVLLLFYGSHLILLIYVKDFVLRISSAFLIVLSIVKVYQDFRNKKDRQIQADKVLGTVGRYGGLLYLAVIFVRWIMSFFGKNIEGFFIVIFAPLGLVIGEVFLLEYGLGKCLTILKILKDQEYYRKVTEITIKDWYGSRSKEYLSKEIKD
jgi:hypothetical protein